MQFYVAHPHPPAAHAHPGVGKGWDSFPFFFHGLENYSLAVPPIFGILDNRRNRQDRDTYHSFPASPSALRTRSFLHLPHHPAPLVSVVWFCPMPPQPLDCRPVKPQFRFQLRRGWLRVIGVCACVLRCACLRVEFIWDIMYRHPAPPSSPSHIRLSTCTLRNRHSRSNPSTV